MHIVYMNSNLENSGGRGGHSAIDRFQIVGQGVKSMEGSNHLPPRTQDVVLSEMLGEIEFKIKEQVCSILPLPDTGEDRSPDVHPMTEICRGSASLGDRPVGENHGLSRRMSK